MNTQTSRLNQWPAAFMLTALLTILALFAATSAYGQATSNPPGQMAFQGFLTDAGTPPVPLGATSPVNKTVTFKIYNDAQSTDSANVLWAEDQIVTIDKGHFSALLGEGSAVSGLAHSADLSGVFTGVDASDRWIGITVDAAEIVPRIRYFPSAYAQLARRARVADIANSLRDAGGATDVVTTQAGRMEVAGELAVNPGPLSLTGNATVSGNLSVTGQSTLTGNLGIGTTTATSMLDIRGTTPVITVGTVIGQEGALYLGNSNHGVVRNYNGGMNDVGLYTIQGDVYISGNGQSTSHLVVKNDGRVGIGTSNPITSLHVAVDRPYSTTLSTYFDSNGVGNWGNGAYNGHYCAIFDGRIFTSLGLHVASDNRIKQISNRASSEVSLDTIRKLKVTDYKYIDKIGAGSRQHRGLIAQELEQIIPEAVNQGTDFIPDILVPASELEFNATRQSLQIKVSKNHGLEVNDVVALILEDGRKEFTVSGVPTPTSFVVKAEKNPGKVFVFGKQVKDFRTVDYDQVFSTGISAIQELDRQIQRLKKSQARIAELEQQVTALSKLVAQLVQGQNPSERIVANSFSSPSAE